MFRPENRISLREVWNALGAEVYKRYKSDGRDDDYQSMSEATAWKCWEFCANARTAHVLMPSGKLESFDRSILFPRDDDLTYNEHVDLQIGTIGSGKTGDQRQRYVQMRYGPALYCPVVFTVAEFSKFLSISTSAPKMESNTDAAIIGRIIAAYKEDPSRNREEIKRIAADGVGVNRYKRLRARAAEIETGISRGGQKASNKP